MATPLQTQVRAAVSAARTLRRVRMGRATRAEVRAAMATWQCEAATLECMAERRAWAPYASQAAAEGLPMHRGMPALVH
jgi:hypothetical protein